MVSLSKNDLSVGQMPVGQRPAVIAVDFSKAFTSQENPLGGDFEAQVQANLSIVEVAKAHRVPVFFTSVVYDHDDQASVFRRRVPALNTLSRDSHWSDINEIFSDFVNPNNLIEKHYASAFFATSLANKLTALDIDSLIITGLTTSGCVRATCVDGLQHNYLCTVVSEACGDRNQDAHDMSLHDMHAKYAQVKALKDVISDIKSVK